MMLTLGSDRYFAGELRFSVHIQGRNRVIRLAGQGIVATEHVISRDVDHERVVLPRGHGHVPCAGAIDSHCGFCVVFCRIYRGIGGCIEDHVGTRASNRVLDGRKLRHIEIPSRERGRIPPSCARLPRELGAGHSTRARDEHSHLNGGRSKRLSERPACCESFSETIGFFTGQSIPIRGSSHLTPRSSVASYRELHL